MCLSVIFTFLLINLKFSLSGSSDHRQASLQVAGYLNARHLLVLYDQEYSQQGSRYLTTSLPTVLIQLQQLDTYFRNILHNSLIVIENEQINSIKHLLSAQQHSGVSKSLWLFILVTDESLEEILQIRFPFNWICLLAVQKKGGKVNLIEVYTGNNQTLLTHAADWVDQKPFAISLTAREDNFEGTIFKMKSVKNCLMFQSCEFLEMWHDLERLLNFRTQEVTYERVPSKSVDLFGLVSPHVLKFHTSYKYFIGPLTAFKLNMYMKTSRTTRTEAYLEQFSPDLWLYILLYLILATSCFTLIGFILKRIQVFNYFSDFLFQPFESLCNQDGSNLPSHVSCRTASLAARLLAAVVVPAFSGAVISSLATQTAHTPFNNVDGFLKDGRYETLTIKRSTSTLFAFAIQRDDDQFDNKWHMAKGINKGKELDMICSSNYVLVYLDTELSSLRPPCQCTPLKHPFRTFSTAVGLRLSGAPFMESINRKILKFHTSGIINRMQKVRTAELAVAHLEENIFALELEHVQSLFMVIVCGWAAAGVFLIIEWVVYKGNAQVEREDLSTDPDEVHQP